MFQFGVFDKADARLRDVQRGELIVDASNWGTSIHKDTGGTMKKIAILISLGCAISGCATPQAMFKNEKTGEVLWRW